MIRVGLIGAGLVGAKRAANLSEAKLIAVQDRDAARAQKLAALYGASVETDWRTLLQRKDIEAVIVATSHDVLSDISTAALTSGKHVLVEKPGGRTAAEVQAQVGAAKTSGKILRVGFNHRFHPSFQKAAAIIKANEVGPVMFARARYGHGGRLGYENEWRADPVVSGGGELLDQGVHLIDLSNWLMGPLEPAWGVANTFFWPMKVEDYGFVALRSADQKRWAWLHASWVEWKNIFSYELFCKNGKLDISGLGGSYGTEELKCYRMKPEMGPPPVDVWTFPGDDVSWKAEWQSFVRAVQGSTGEPGATGEDAVKTLDIVHWVYNQKREPTAV